MSLADFLGSLLTCAVASPRGDRRTLRFGSGGGFACPPRRLHPSTAYSVRPRRCHSCVSTSHTHASNVILNVSSIGLAVRLILRTRLTLGRLTLPGKPWSFGGRASHPPYRYLFLHLLFRALQQSSRTAFNAHGMLPYRCKMHPIASATGLIPDYYPRAVPRLVSCYALFE